MKITKLQLKVMINESVRRRLGRNAKRVNEGFSVNEDEYYKLKKSLENDFFEIYELAGSLEDSLYEDESEVDPIGLVEKIRLIAGKHTR